MTYMDIILKGSDKVANEQNLKVPTSEEARENGKKGGIASGIVRKEKATFKNAIKWLVESDIKIKDGNIYDYFKNSGIDISNLKPAQLATLGLWNGAIQGKAENFKTLMEANEEIEDKDTPAISINIIDNSNFEKVLYEDNNTKDTTNDK